MDSTFGGFADLRLVSNDVVAAMVGESAAWHVMGLRMGERAKAMAPVGHTEMETGQYGPEEPHGALRDSMEVRFQEGPDPRIEIGSKLQTSGRNPVSLFELITNGTEAHPIDASPGGVLTFVKGGTRVFTTHVNHPGTKKNGFVIRAARLVVREAGGLATVSSIS